MSSIQELEVCKEIITMSCLEGEALAALKEALLPIAPDLDKESNDQAATPSNVASSTSSTELPEAISRPPSPPESIPSRVSIITPARWVASIPPYNYGAVETGSIYRGSFPLDRNISFMKSLDVRSVLSLVDTAPSADFAAWLTESNIKRGVVSIAANKTGPVNITVDSVCRAIMFLMNDANKPVYIHCNQGKHRTGCVVACLRKVFGATNDQAIAEYTTYAGNKGRTGDINFIRCFQQGEILGWAIRNRYWGDAMPVQCNGQVTMMMYTKKKRGFTDFCKAAKAGLIEIA